MMINMNVTYMWYVKAYSPVALFLLKITAQGVPSLYNLSTSFAQGLIVQDYPELFALGSWLVNLIVIYTGLLPVILCCPKSQRIRSTNSVILLRIDKLMLNLFTRVLQVHHVTWIFHYYLAKSNGWYPRLP